MSVSAAHYTSFTFTTSTTDSTTNQSAGAKHAHIQLKGGQNVEQTTNVTNWLDEETKTLNSTANFGEKLPSLKLETNTVTEFTVDFSAPFKKWSKTETT